MSRLTLEKASAIIDGVLAKAREIEAAPLAVTVVDEGGHIVAFKREDGATTLRFNIATGKAWGAVSMGIPSRKFAEMAQERPSFIAALSTMTDGKIVPSAGGILIKNDAGEVIGAVGVSGDLPDTDEKCAIAGIPHP